MRLSTPVQNPLAAEEATEGRVSKTAGCRSVCCTCTDYLKSFKERVLFGGSHNNYNLCWPTTIPATEKTQPWHVYVNEKLLKKVFSSSGQPTGGKPTTCHSVFFFIHSINFSSFFLFFFCLRCPAGFLFSNRRVSSLSHSALQQIWTLAAMSARARELQAFDCICGGRSVKCSPLQWWANND